MTSSVGGPAVTHDQVEVMTMGARRVPHKGKTIRLGLVPGERMHFFDSRSADRLG
jgi:hypothetical protein